MDWMTILMRIGAAMGLGGLIGIERELHGKTAGLRTNMLICLGAAMFILVAKQLGVEDGNAEARVISGIVTGVGFVGAGAIIQGRGSIQGLTTATGIWVNAAVGIACGSGYYQLAAIGTGAILLVLWVLHPLAGVLRNQLKIKEEDE